MTSASAALETYFRAFEIGRVVPLKGMDERVEGAGWPRRSLCAMGLVRAEFEFDINYMH